MDLQTAIDLYLRDVAARGLSGKTQRRYRDDLVALDSFLGGLSVGVVAITADCLRGYFAQMQCGQSARRKPFSAFTVEGRWRSVKTFLAFCLGEGWIAVNPMARMGRPRLPERIVPRLGDQQIVLLMRALSETQHAERNLAMVALMVDSGMRRGEVVALELSRLDLPRKRARIIGKGNRERVVPLSPVAVSFLRRWLKVRPSARCDRVFVREDGSPISGNLIRLMFDRLRNRLGFPLYAHLLRHTFGTRSLARHGNCKVLQQTLGHKNSRTTLDFYVSYDEEELVAIHRRGSPLMGLRRRLAGRLG